MKLEAIHIVSLDVPFPPDYGGTFDIYYKCQVFKSFGIRVILHCFEYGRGTDHDISGIADEVYYYKRKKSVIDLFRKTPFIIASRKSEALVQRLLQDNYPIFIEGDHCAALLLEDRLKDRLFIQRIHNIEWKYYEALAESEPSLLKRWYFRMESRKLKAFEKVLESADILVCVSQTELKYWQAKHSNAHLWVVNCIFGMNETLLPPDNFALFQGNLSVAENEKAVRWIVEQWKAQAIDVPLVIAGRNPRPALQSMLAENPWIRTVYNPSIPEMDKLIQTAAMNLLFTFQTTGVKLKLVNALFQGHRCIANPQIVEGTSFEPFCEMIRNGEELREAVLRPEDAPGIPDRKERLDFLRNYFDLQANMRPIIALIEKEMNSGKKAIR